MMTILKIAGRRNLHNNGFIFSLLLVLLVRDANGVTCVSRCKTCNTGSWLRTTIFGSHGDPLCYSGEWYSGLTGFTGGSGTIRGCCKCAKGKYLDIDEVYSWYKEGNKHSYHDSYTSCELCPFGKVATSTGSSSCSKCNAGKIPSYDRTSCTNCPDGRYQDEKGQTSCKSGCLAGTELNNTGTCVPCSILKYQNEHGMTSCKSCPTAKQAPTTGSTAESQCAGCSAGTAMTSATGSANGLVCTVCGAGRFRTTASLSIEETCEPCPNGKSATSTGSTSLSSCTACAAGTIKTLSAPVTCTTCAAGKYRTGVSTDTGDTCLNCDAGKYIEADQDPQYHDSESSCKNCAVQEESTEARDKCRSCLVGKYQDQEGDGVCKTCEAGKQYDSSSENLVLCTMCSIGQYQASNDQVAACINCPTGRFILDDGNTADMHDTEDDCKYCVVGKQFTTKTTPCEICVTGKYQGANNVAPAECIECPTGRFILDAGSADIYHDALEDCIHCVAGKQFTSKTTECTICIGGKYQSVTNAAPAVCKNCPENTFIFDNGDKDEESIEKHDHVSDCIDCPEGKFADANFANRVCTGCTVGKLVVNGQCIECDEGYYGDMVDSEASCVICPTGFYQKIEGRSYCLPCIPGEYQDVEGQTKCKQCEEGKFSNNIEQTECTTCPPAKTAVNKGAVTCDVCPGGRYGDECDLCNKGQFRISGDQVSDSCKNCPAGFSQKEQGQMLCLSCVPTEYQDAEGASSCKQCEIETFSNTTELTICFNCPSGETAKEKGSAACQKCDAGKAGDDCDPCVSGKYRSATDTQASFCRACPAGFHQKNDGSAACLQCTPGQAQSLESQHLCVPCVAGKYLPSDAPNPRNTCIDCEKGKQQNDPESVSCLFCGPGQYQDELAQITCVECDVGTVRSASNKDYTRCVNCEIGRYQLLVAQASCLNCLPGKFQDTPGQGDSDCKDCIEGKYQGGSGKGTCIEKTEGKVVDEKRSSQSDVPEGSSILCNEISKRCTTFEACAAGKYGIEDRSKCNSCPKGKFSSKGSIKCQQCDKGKFAGSLGSASCTVCDRAQRMFSDVAGSSICKTCEAGKVSIGDECQTAAINNDLAVPDNVELVLTQQQDWNSITIKWTVDGTKGTTPIITYDVQYSKSPEFPDDKRTEQRTVNTTKAVIAFKKPTSEAVTYIRIRGVGTNKDEASAWSLTNEKWITAEDCKVRTQYLNTTSIQPTEWKCNSCPRGADCYSKSTIYNLLPKDGYHAMSWHQNTFGECPKSSACNMNASFSGGCTEGHDSNSSELCNQCIGRNLDSNVPNGYASQGIGQACEKCPETVRTNGLFVGATFMTIALFSFLVYDNISGANDMIPKNNNNNNNNDNDNNDKTSMPFHSIVIRIVSSYLQVSGMLLHFDLTLPDPVTKLIIVEASASSLSETLLLFDCATPIRNERDLFILKQTASIWMIPLLSIIACFIFWFFAHIICLRKNRRKINSMTGIDGFISSTMVLFYTLFPSIVNRVALTFSCKLYGTKEHERVLLTEALSIQCWSPEHWAMVGYVGIPGVLVYVILIPIVIALILIRQRKKQTLYTTQQHYNPKWTLRFGFMFAGYREGFEWWESIVMLRKCCFVLLAIFLRQYGAAPQVVAASIVLVMALSAELQNLPYQDKQHDRIETIGIQACLLQLLVALLCNLLRDQPIDNSEDVNNSLGMSSTALLIIVVFGSTFIFFTFTIRATIQGSQNYEGIVGCIARLCGDRCGKKEKRKQKIPRSVVVPAQDMHVYAALKLRQNVHNALNKKLDMKKAAAAAAAAGGGGSDTTSKPNSSIIRIAEKIQRNSTNHRNSAVQVIQKRHIQRRNILQAKVKARNTAKQCNALQNCKVFSQVDELSRAVIIDQMELEIKDAGTEICKQGDVADILYLLLAGSCIVFVNEKKVATLNKKYQVFGEGALFPNKDGIAIRSGTVIAAENVQLLCLSKVKFEQLLDSGTLDNECMAKLEHIAQQRVAEDARREVLEKEKGEMKLTEPKHKGAMKLTEPENEGGMKLTEPPLNENKIEKVLEEIRKLMEHKIKSSKILRKIYSKFNKNGKDGVDQLDRVNFEAIISKALEMKKMGSIISNDEVWDDIWISACGDDGTKDMIQFDCMEVWLGFKKK